MGISCRHDPDLICCSGIVVDHSIRHGVDWNVFGDSGLVLWNHAYDAADRHLVSGFDSFHQKETDSRTCEDLCPSYRRTLWLVDLVVSPVERVRGPDSRIARHLW